MNSDAGELPKKEQITWYHDGRGYVTFIIILSKWFVIERSRVLKGATDFNVSV